jgi:27-O-demethylrifamycin SV methyltransferase
MPVDAKEHYEHVTDAWKEFMGEHLHFGYFESKDMDLARATEVMADKMLELCPITADSRVLDVGCGIGGPAFYLHSKTGCSIDGISTSERGVELANAASREKGYDNKVRFKVADGMDNGFPDETFDVAWVMESSHLMADKRRLLRECYRVLKKGGTLVLCDLISLMNMPFYREMIVYALRYKEFMRLLKAFGPGNVTRLGIYCDFCVEAGFREFTAFNITEHTTPTMMRWRDNAIRFRDNESGDFSREDVEDFIAGCETLDKFFRKGRFGYGMLRAIK